MELTVRFVCTRARFREVEEFAGRSGRPDASRQIAGGFFLWPHFARRIREDLSRPSKPRKIVDSALITELFLHWVATIRPGAKIFTVSRDQGERRVRRVVQALGLDEEDTVLHRLKHTGPANDIAENRRTLEQARRRGRWLHLTSVLRYTKEAHLVACASRMPTLLRRAVYPQS